MTRRSRLLRGSLRAVAGLFIVALVAAGIAATGFVTPPTLDREPLAITVDTTQDTTRTLACAGSFAELGADPAQPGVAIPTGEPEVAISGTPSETGGLSRPEGGDAAPAVLSAASSELLGAAQLQGVATATLRGAVASACAEPLNEQWLLGGGSGLGVSTTISLGNPGEVAATVELAVYDENGPVSAVEGVSVLVPAGTEQTVSLNGYAPDRERLAVQVLSTGAPVVATLGVGEVLGLAPYAVSSVNAQSAPATRLVIPGVTNVSDQKQGPSDAGEGDPYPVIVRAMAPGGETGSARVWAVAADGGRTDLGEVPLVGGAVGELRVVSWPEGANAVVIESDAAIIGGVLGSATEGDEHDYEWFTPASEIDSGAAVSVPVVSGGKLVIVNPGERDAQVRISGGDGKSRDTVIAAGAAVSTQAHSNTTIETSEPLYAGVRFVSGGDIAGYPVLAPDPRDGELTVYTR